jgi:hypothetical protein
MRRSFPLALAIVAVVVTSAAVVVFALAVLRAPTPGERGVAAPPSAASQPPYSQGADEQEAVEDEPVEERLPAGRVVPLTLDQDTREQLSAAARAADDATGHAKGAVNVATGGTTADGS